MATGQASPKAGKVIDIPANAPTIGTATDSAAGGTVSVPFTAGSTTTGGPIFSYRAVSNPGSITGTGTSSPITVSGLTDGTAYTFTVAAVNATGNSPFSAASNSATPTLPPGSFESIASAAGTGSSGTITFSSIPSTYKHLQIRFQLRGTSNGEAVYLYFNSDTAANYAFHTLQSNGTGTASDGYAGSANITHIATFATGTSTTNFNAGICDIYNYASTTQNKTSRIFVGIDKNGSGSVELHSTLWLNANAISSISMVTSGGNFTTDSTFALYGIKG